MFFANYCMVTIDVLKVGNNCIILSNNSSDCIIFDPGNYESKILDYLNSKKLIPKSIYLTHGHYDHIGAIDSLVKEFSNVDVYVSKEDSESLNDPSKNYSYMFCDSPIKINNFKIIDFDTIHFEDLIIKIIKTPGHTKGGVCYYLDNDSPILISGDTLFYETWGRTDLYGGSEIEIKNSISKKLFILPKNTRVIPGHGHETTIGYEIKFWKDNNLNE
jgi:hydroxyacylglutathione hydrolase